MLIKALAIISTLSGFSLSAQERPVEMTLIAFYNVENLFEVATGNPQDNAYRFEKPAWDSIKYNTKVGNLARVIRSLGQTFNLSGPDLLGLAEIQNTKVIRDLTTHSYLEDLGYEIVHFDSPDHRGIDVALLFKKTSFLPVHSHTRHLYLQDANGYVIKTRDILVVSGYLDQEMVHLLVNHWPSRRGGASKSSNLRREAARLNRKIIDSLRHRYSDPFILTMGDFNDDPTDNSIYHILGGREAVTASDPHHMMNPMLPLFRKGFGSLAYRDTWHLFDQILINRGVITPNEMTYEFSRAGIFMPPWLKVKQGRYKGYPLRTYSGNTYTGGYSDHFPVYLLFRQKQDRSGEPDIIRYPE